jgi:hypothetical protein
VGTVPPFTKVFSNSIILTVFAQLFVLIILVIRKFYFKLEMVDKSFKYYFKGFIKNCKVSPILNNRILSVLDFVSRIKSFSKEFHQ